MCLFVEKRAASGVSAAGVSCVVNVACNVGPGELERPITWGDAN